MNGGNFSNMSFQTFYVTREKSDCPFIPDVIKTGRKIQDKLGENVEVTVSLRYGKRVLINTNIGSFKSLNRDGFLEVVDYDPLKNILLVIGSNNPKPVSTVHWLIHHARDEINAVVEVDFDVSSLKKTKGIPSTEKDYPVWSLEFAKEILGLLRDSKKVIVKNQGLFFVGNSIKQVEDSVLKTI